MGNFILIFLSFLLLLYFFVFFVGSKVKQRKAKIKTKYVVSAANNG